MITVMPEIFRSHGINGNNTVFMKTFIEDYLHNPSEAIAKAAESLKVKCQENIDDEMIYNQISSSEFNLYTEIIFA